MARNDQTGFFWDDYVPPKIKKEKVKCEPPEPVWLNDDYLPYLFESKLERTDLFTQAELRQSWLNKEPLVFDIECYHNYFIIGFKSVNTKKVCYWEMFENTKLETESLKWLIQNFQLISFNGISYDIPILTLALNKKPCRVLKDATNMLINYNMRADDILKEFKCPRLKKVDHIDLIEVAPLSAGLKIYSGRLHCHRMQDLPFHPDKVLNKEQMDIVRYYNINDLDNTLLMYENLKTELELRVELTQQYGIDLRSKSDAQIAEAVIRTELTKKGSGKLIKPQAVPRSYFYYDPPTYLNFQTVDIMERIAKNPFFITESGKVAPCYYADFIDWGKEQLRLSPNNEWVKKPKDFKYSNVVIHGVEYKMGMGGLHTVEKSICYKSDENYTLRDVDVESYYPRIILNLELYPEQLGINFLMVYNGIVERRLAAKLCKKLKESNSLKIVINGSFGKFGSVYSILYAPKLIIQTTLTGQLSLLMLIEWLGLAGIQVVSANTDGVVSYVGKHQEEQFKVIVEYWEKLTNFKMEETLYSALYSRDVNNYIAVKTDGKVKHKGAYSNHWNDNSSFRFHKNPTNLICIDAVTDYLVKGTPIETTIYNSKDITKFITVRDVKGGGVKMWSKDNIDYLGKAVRWYYGKDIEGEIVYAKSGKKAARTEGAKPCMQLPDKFPDDINYDWYIEECQNILIDIGAVALVKN